MNFSSETVEDGYVIYYNKKLQYWEVLDLLQELLKCRSSLSQIDIDVPMPECKHPKTDNRTELVREIASLLNKMSRENISNTPDFILAEVMVSALENFEKNSNRREEWYGRNLNTSP